MDIRLIVALAAAVAWSVPAAAAERWNPDTGPCNSEVSTPEIVDCLDARTGVWDRRLNDVYKSLQATLKDDPASKPQSDRLTAAQRLWLQYRDANCTFYASGQGSIRLIEAAECRRRMTQERALELQQAAGDI